MSYIQEAHAEWHIVNGKDAICPLDCYDPPEPDLDEQIAAYEESEAYWDSLMANEPVEEYDPTEESGWVK